MAGSKDFFQYMTDYGREYTVELDKTNAQGYLFTGQVFSLPRTINSSGQIPKIIKPRILHLRNAANIKVWRHIVIGNPEVIRSLVRSDSIQDYAFMQLYPNSLSETWRVTGYTGESATILFTGE